MSDLNAIEYKRFEDIKRIREDGSEYWSARELGPALDYAQWRNFSKVIDRAMIDDFSYYHIQKHVKIVDIMFWTILLRSAKS